MLPEHRHVTANVYYALKDIVMIHSPIARSPPLGPLDFPFRPTLLARVIRLVMQSLGASALLASAAHAQELPSGGIVTAGNAAIATGAQKVTVTQSSAAAAINWHDFSIGKDNSVVFVQPNSSAVALNRVTGADPSVILGKLSANGKVFLVNSNGIVFGKSANVNVGGLVASTLNISDADFMAGNYTFSGTGGSVLNQGSIVANRGYVALLGATVDNQGLIQANLGTVALAAGNAITLDVAGDGLLNVAVDTGAVNALVQNGGLLRANGGAVVMTAQAAGQLLKTVVNNTGVIEARSIQNRPGSIRLLGDMSTGTVTVGGTLDASAADRGDGGFIDTSAAHVDIANSANISTASRFGTTGTWLIDPQDFTIAADGNISGDTLSALLVTNSVVISTLTGLDTEVAGTPPVTDLYTDVTGNGDINVNEAIAWTASPSTTTLTFNATRDLNVNAAITATNGNVVACCGRDVNVNAAITTTNGSVLLSSGRDVNINPVGFNAVNSALAGVLTLTDGNLMICAGVDVLVAGAITLTRGTTVESQSLGLDSGLKIVTGNNGTGPGIEGGTLTIDPGTAITVTAAAAQINYNPVSYASPSDYSIDFILSEGAALTQRMLVFPTADKTYDGTTDVVLTGLASTTTSGLPTGVTLVAGADATAVYDSADVGTNIGITYSGYTLGGENADLYALAEVCCGKATRSTGTISAAPPVDVPPVDVPPVDVPPVEVPPVDVPPVDVPPVEVPPVEVPPVEVPPVVVPPEVVPPEVVPPVIVPPSSGTVVNETPPPIVLIPPGLGIVVHEGGLPPPPEQLVTLVPPVVPPPVIVPPVIPVAPPRIYPLKQDRN